MKKNYFQKGFDATYNAKVKCPECKLDIPEKANICPYCLTDLRSEIYNHLTSWQGVAYKIIFFISAIITISLFFNTDFPALLNIIIGLAFWGLCKIIVTKLQSFINRQN